METATGSATPATAVVSPSASGYNPKVTLAYAPVEDLNAYATAAKGFRPGGINLPFPLVGPTSSLPSLHANGLTSAPVEYGPDSVWNYELGEKTPLNNERLTVNAHAYYIRWTGMQHAI